MDLSQRIRDVGLAHPLGTIGDAYDNAVVESFWARMQTELLNRQKWKNRIELSTAMFDWIEALSRYAGDNPWFWWAGWPDWRCGVHAVSHLADRSR